ncbi:MAG: hypothetical protein ACREJD_01895 [Phycisphaerales bacterium]
MGKSQIESKSSVVLRHTLPDGSVHLDWMIETDVAERGLVSFRLAEGVDLMEAGMLGAERIGEHRRDYLTYEGVVSSGRGSVKRVGEFEVCGLEESERRIRVVLKEKGGSGRRMNWAGEWEIGTRWKFVGVVC